MIPRRAIATTAHWASCARSKSAVTTARASSLTKPWRAIPALRGRIICLHSSSRTASPWPRFRRARLPASEAMPAARAHLERALSIDPEFAQARALLAWLSGVWERDWTKALSEVRRAVRSAPGNFAVRNTCGNLHALMGRVDEAEAELARAIDLDPLHLTPRYNAGYAAWYAGRHDLAVERCDAILDVDPQHAAAGLRVAALIAGKRTDA